MAPSFLQDGSLHSIRQNGAPNKKPVFNILATVFLLYSGVGSDLSVKRESFGGGSVG